MRIRAKFSDNGVGLLEYCKGTYENLKRFFDTIENDFLLSNAKNFYAMKE